MHAVQEEAQDKTSSTEGKPIPTKLRNEEAKLRQEIDVEDENTAGTKAWATFDSEDSSILLINQEASPITEICVILTMTLHNYIRRHARRDGHFVHGEEREGDGSSRGIEMDDDVEEEYHGHDAQEMEIIRNNITQSLMSARHDMNI